MPRTGVFFCLSARSRRAPGGAGPRPRLRGSIAARGRQENSELATVHVAIEGVSHQVAKAIEDCRLASFTEKSTRYVPWDRNQIFVEPQCGEESYDVYMGAINRLMDTYESLYQKLDLHYRSTIARDRFKTPAAWENNITGTVCDVVRYLLPIGSLTNLGLTMNGRAAEGLIKKLLVHPLPEVRRVGKKIHKEVKKVLPTLVKYADTNLEYRQNRHSYIDRWLEDCWGPVMSLNTLEEHPGASPQTVVDDERTILSKIAAAIIYPRLKQPFGKVLCRMKWMNREDIVNLVQQYVRGREFTIKPGTPDERVMCQQLLRAFEMVDFTTEMICDYGAWRDIQRHRMATQFLQGWDTRLGWTTPPTLKELGLERDFDAAVVNAHHAYHILSCAGIPEASYVLPMATNVRSTFKWNLRELDHFIRLRSFRHGNPGYRRLAQDLHGMLERFCPVVERPAGPTFPFGLPPPGTRLGPVNRCAPHFSPGARAEGGAPMHTERDRRRPMNSPPTGPGGTGGEPRPARERDQGRGEPRTRKPSGGERPPGSGADPDRPTSESEVPAGGSQYGAGGPAREEMEARIRSRWDPHTDLPRPSPFGVWLTTWRLAKGWRQADLAGRLGLHSGRVSELEAGRRRPSRELARRIHEALGDEVPAPPWPPD